MTMTFDEDSFHPRDRRRSRAQTTATDLPVSVQILSTILFAAFAIPVTIVALNVFWPAGVAMALMLAWRGGFAPTGRPSPAPRNVEEAVQSLVPTARDRSSGNASFDAYKAEMMDRLEAEQTNFEAFLERLRATKDQSEFDRFMDDRAERVSRDEAQALAEDPAP